MLFVGPWLLQKGAVNIPVCCMQSYQARKGKHTSLKQIFDKIEILIAPIIFFKKDVEVILLWRKSQYYPWHSIRLSNVVHLKEKEKIFLETWLTKKCIHIMYNPFISAWRTIVLYRPINDDLLFSQLYLCQHLEWYWDSLDIPENYVTTSNGVVPPSLLGIIPDHS